MKASAYFAEVVEIDSRFSLPAFMGFLEDAEPSASQNLTHSSLLRDGQSWVHQRAPLPEYNYELTEDQNDDAFFVAANDKDSLCVTGFFTERSRNSFKQWCSKTIEEYGYTYVALGSYHGIVGKWYVFRGQNASPPPYFK